ncbi:MAG: protein kinase [Candidatus Sumerlaeia bacterium]|nr:protein kinase [Candidatus Sumerlaeia bacterium]
MGIQVRRGASLLAAGLVAGGFGAWADEPRETFTRRKTPLDTPNAVIAANLVRNEVPEIIATDVGGRIAVFDATSGEMILQAVDEARRSLTAPVVGDFARDSSLDIAFGTEDGRVVFLNGGNLTPIAEAQVSTNSFVESPTVVYLPLPGSPGTFTEIVVLADQGGQVISVYLDDARQAKSYWEPVRTGSKAAAPLSLGSPRISGQIDIAVPTSDGKLLLIESFTGRATQYNISEQHGIATTVLLADLTGNGRDELVFTLANGDIEIRTHNPATDRLDVLNRFATGGGGAVTGDPVLVMPKDRGPGEALIFQGLGSAGLVAIDVSRRAMLRGDRTSFAGINSQLSVLWNHHGGFPVLAFAQGTQVRMLETSSWFQGVPALDEPQVVSIGQFVGHTMPVIGVPEQEGGRNAFKYHLIGMTLQGMLFGIDTGRTFSVDRSPEWPSLSPWLSPWMTRAATPRRNARVDLVYLQRESQRAARLEAEVAKIADRFNTAREAKDWDEALAAAATLRDYDPFNVQYQSQYRQMWIRRNLVWLIAAGVGVLAVLLLLTYVVGRFVYLAHLERRARTSVSKGRMDEAEVLYERLLARKPRSQKIVATLAMVYMSNKNFDARTIDIYRRTHEKDPENPNLLHCYARALLQGEKRDAQARAVFEAALKSFPEPQVLEYAIGMCHKEAGNFDEAAKRLRAALRAGLTANHVYAALCDVYLETNNRTAKALPVYHQQFQGRQEDSRFLEAYLDSCIDAKKGDAEVESLCHRVLEYNRSYVPAYCHLCTIYMQKNEVGRAVEEAKSALQVEPSNERAIQLLAQCYLVEGRGDQAAQEAFQRALALQPEDAELLRTLAEIHFRAGNFTKPAVDIYHRSRRANPNDAVTLKALAETARLAGTHDLAIDVIETLFQLGFGEAQYSRQLARSYMATGVYRPEAERVYREALRAEPDNAQLVKALATVLERKEDEGGEAIPVYEAHLVNDPADRNIGAMLVRSYIKANRYQDALGTAQALLRHHPDDGELKRLIALASLYDNKLDEAVREYTAILQRNPNDQEAMFHLAMAYAHKGRADDECARLYQRALQVRSDVPELHLALARVHLERNDTVKAVESYQNVMRSCPGAEETLLRHIGQMLQQHPEAMRVRWFLCELLVAYGHLREAMEQLDWIYSNNPNHAQNVLGALDKILSKEGQYLPALQSQARILVATGDMARARASLEKAYKLQPNSPEVIRALADVYERILTQKDEVEVRFRLGRLYYMIQEYDSAIGCFQKTAQDYRWEAESIKMLGKCFTNKGMLDLALQEFKKLVVDEETKELLYDLAQRYEGKKDLVGAKTVYRQLFAADIDYKDVKTRFEMLSGSTSDPMAFEKTSIVQQMSEDAKRRYELLDELGRGAMGIVYRARDKELEEVVALKILPDAMSNNPEAVRRFKIEARNARRLSHPNIVRIHDIGEEMGRKYISMEYVDGSDLKKRVKTEGKLSMEDLFLYAIDIADALGYAHRLGIVHRDIKPANIMLTSTNQVKVTDFGIAKMLDSTMNSGEGTMVGAVIGTPLYMSPEQVQGIAVDNRADLYSFGIMLYEFVAGRPPFIQGDLAYQHMHQQPQRPENCPDALWNIIAKCLAKEKEDRWEKGEDIVEALKQARREVLGV